jgi:hypothetical protein
MEKQVIKLWKKNGKIASSIMLKDAHTFLHVLSKLIYRVFKDQIDIINNIHRLYNNKYYINIKEVLYYEIHM